MTKKQAARLGKKQTRLHAAIPPVNTSFLLGRLQTRGISGREAARRLGIDAGSAVRLFHGKRRLKLSEAPALAQILDMPVGDVLSLFGVDTGAIGEGLRTIKIEGWLDGTLCLLSVREGAGLRGKPTATVPFPDKDLHCARFQTAGTEFAGWDGKLLFYRLSKAKGVRAEDVGTACLVKIDGEPHLKLREIRRGYTTGRYSLHALNGRLMEEDCKVEITHPISWIRM